MEHGYGCNRRFFAGCGMILLAMGLCFSTVILALDGTCASSLTQRLPIYPGADVVSSQHSFLRPFGVGVTVIILYSPDPPDTVRSWYARTIGAYLREQAARGGGIGIASTDWTVGRAEDGVGSQIILYGSCVS
jgi:hypothetical protein